MMNFFKIAVMAVLLIAGHARAEISVEGEWVRLLPPMVKTTAAYMTLTSSIDDTLVSASSPQASMVELHLSSMSNGVMSMDHVEEIALLKGQPLKLAPGGYHLMLMGLKASLKEGDTFQLHLQFAKSGELIVNAEVKQ
ncbi:MULTISPECIES: copper chaperone PCu(A)C [unclassified Oleiphilus]|jgi:copper(I)-binding protein|nr:MULTISPECIES: copper chaperone PCu(A)C [unclassified Oleiphilus]